MGFRIFPTAISRDTHIPHVVRDHSPSWHYLSICFELLKLFKLHAVREPSSPSEDARNPLRQLEYRGRFLIAVQLCKSLEQLLNTPEDTKDVPRYGYASLKRVSHWTNLNREEQEQEGAHCLS